GETEIVPATTKAGGLESSQGTIETPGPAKANGKANGKTNGHHHTNGNDKGKPSTLRLEQAGMKLKDSDATADRSDQFSKFQTDAPSCDNCGAITVRNGNCYLCHNCGNSMGCS
ncbi:MAG: vitamin B12-dependent ribonucleotide reductase, partial [Pirellulales bacterium]